ncbi:hypothetical protein D3C76_1172530 [compost metagenome]
MRQSMKAKAWQSLQFIQAAGQREATILSHLQQSDDREIMNEVKPSRQSLSRQ